MNSAELVAVRIAHISQIRLATKSWRIFDRLAAIRDTSFVPGGGLLLAAAQIRV